MLERIFQQISHRLTCGYYVQKLWHDSKFIPNDPPITGHHYIQYVSYKVIMNPLIPCTVILSISNRMIKYHLFFFLKNLKWKYKMYNLHATIPRICMWARKEKIRWRTLKLWFWTKGRVKKDSLRMGLEVEDIEPTGICITRRVRSHPRVEIL